MGRIAFFVIALLLSSAAQAANRPESGKTFVFLIGDSQSINLRAPLAAHFKGKYSFDSLGKTGATAKWWLQHESLIRSKLANRRPDLTIIVLGTNDGVTKKRARIAGQSFPALVKLMRTLGNKPVVWVTPPEVPNVPYLAQIRETAKKLDCMVADFAGLHYPLRRKGNFHLSPAGYQLWSDRLVEKINF
jgi:lysophospholipase L1-like esterase